MYALLVFLLAYSIFMQKEKYSDEKREPEQTNI